MAHPIDKTWLTQRMTNQELEKQLGVPLATLKQVGSSSNKWFEMWSGFVKQQQGADEFWLYSRPDSDGAIDGEEGVALVRSGKIISHVVTRSS